MSGEEWRWVGPDGFEYTGSEEKLRAKLSSGELPWSTSVWHEGQDEWKPASDITELAPPAPVPVVAAPPAPEPAPAPKPAPLPKPAPVLEPAPAPKPAPLPEPAPPLKTQPLLEAPLPPEPAPEPAPPKPASVPEPVPMVPVFVVDDEAPTRRENPLPEPMPAAPPKAALAAPSEAWAAPRSRGPSRTALFAGACVLGMGVLGALVTYYVVNRSSDDAKTASSAATPSSKPVASAPAPKEHGCHAGRPRVIAKSVYGRVSPELASAGANRVAVAFAEDRKSARSVVLTLDALSVASDQKKKSNEPIAGVVPRLSGADVAIEVDAEKKDATLYTLGGANTVRLLVDKDALKRSTGGDDGDPIWDLPGKGATALRADTLADVGFFVALRRGGQAGKLAAGWLDPGGKKKTELVTPRIAAHAVGIPAGAAGPNTTVLVVAARDGAKDPWRLFGGTAASGQVPADLAPLELGEKDQSRISPSAARLGDSEFAIQWTEGEGDAHTVKVQVVDSRLVPMGEAVPVSIPGSDAGQGVLWSDGEHVVSIFLVSTGAGHELWASLLGCS